MTLAFLSDRGVLSVSGGDAQKFLQGLLTNDMGLLDKSGAKAGANGRAPAIHAGLLSPQGKILFDFFVVKGAEGFLLDVARDAAAGLSKRLSLYKLRAAVDVRDCSEELAVYAAWDGPADLLSGEVLRFDDPRRPELGVRILAAKSGVGAVADDSTYQAHRIGCGVPEGGKDYAFGDAFPHEALFDQLGGVSFTKGCYVGQEIVARMEHRGTARKRVVPVLAAADLPAPGTEIVAGDVVVGQLGSVAGVRGLALLRLDRVAEFAAKGVPLTAAGTELSVKLPAWATFALPSV